MLQKEIKKFTQSTITPTSHQSLTLIEGIAYEIKGNDTIRNSKTNPKWYNTFWYKGHHIINNETNKSLIIELDVYNDPWVLEERNL